MIVKAVEPKGVYLKFQAVFFDLFNTLLHFDFSRLPQVNFRGESLRTTTVSVYEKIKKQWLVTFSYEEFLEEFVKTKEIVRKMRGPEYREIPSLQRFQILSDRLELKQKSAARLILKAHTDEMLRTIYLPDENKVVLNKLSKYPLVLASNFDHAPTARAALRQFEIEEKFKFIFISEEVGWRKPGGLFFEKVLNDVPYKPNRCLYVGDDPEADVLGAGQVDFKVAWLTKSETSIALNKSPMWTIQHLTQVLDIIGGGVH